MAAFNVCIAPLVLPCDSWLIAISTDSVISIATVLDQCLQTVNDFASMARPFSVGIVISQRACWADELVVLSSNPHRMVYEQQFEYGLLDSVTETSFLAHVDHFFMTRL